jgi:hypothetical protein
VARLHPLHRPLRRVLRGRLGRFLHHHPEGSGSGAGDAIEDQLARTVIAWSLVAEPGECCVLWDLDSRAGVEPPSGIPPDRVAAVEAHVRR